jgi:hypothetical protein
VFKEVKSQKQINRTHFTHFSLSFATRQTLKNRAQFLQKRIAKNSRLRKSNCWRRRMKEDDFWALNIKASDFSRRKIWKKEVVLRFYLTCRKQRENKSNLSNKVQKARKMSQMSKIQNNRTMIQMSKIQKIHKMNKMSRTQNDRKMIRVNQSIFLLL